MTAPLRPSLTHTGIYVRDLARMTRFYTEIMNLVISDKGHGFSMPVNIVFLTADPTKHHQFVLAEGRKDNVQVKKTQIRKEYLGDAPPPKKAKKV